MRESTFFPSNRWLSSSHQTISRPVWLRPVLKICVFIDVQHFSECCFLSFFLFFLILYHTVSRSEHLTYIPKWTWHHSWTINKVLNKKSHMFVLCMSFLVLHLFMLWFIWNQQPLLYSCSSRTRYESSKSFVSGLDQRAATNWTTFWTSLWGSITTADVPTQWFHGNLTLRSFLLYILPFAVDAGRRYWPVMLCLIYR